MAATLVTVGAAVAKAQPSASQPAPTSSVDPSLLKSLHWRGIGPLRGGRTRGITGVPSQPNVFYIGVCNGGVWKTNDYGRTWKPVFDDQPTGSIGAVAVAPSDPNIIYVASGEGLHRPDLSVGDGVYRSLDGGKTWQHVGMHDSQQLPQIAVDPRNPQKLYVAAAGHPYGPNFERGVYRSVDGGQYFQPVLQKDDNVGASDVLFDPSNSNIVYATLWEAREGPWENGSWNGNGGGIYKSTNDGFNWEQLGGGLPKDIFQSHIAISASNPKRLIASVAYKPGNVGLFRSDDAGATWTQITTDTRPAGRIGGGDLPVPMIDPKNQDIIYSVSTVTWKSTDGGKTWTGFRGAPGGDDYQNIWINPNNPEIIALASDQGAIITVNGGETWSSWYTQSTAQMYHVSADSAFPYRLCGGQQESGSACVSSRGDDGQITFREWHPVAAEEYGYVTADPLDPDTVYGGKLTRYDRRTGQGQNIMPKPFRGQDFRVLRTEPVIFSPHDPHVLYFAGNTLWKTRDGGQSWQQISPDLTRKTFEIPPSIGKFRNEATAQPTQRGVIYTVAPSPLEAGRIWAGTDDGLIHLTTDGGDHWTEITPKDMKPFQKVSLIEASHFDSQTAYAAINTLRLDDLRPHILRTRDSGKSWTEIVEGIGTNENVNAVREDPKRKGLLFAGTERAVYVSFDDGDHWQSLRLNMPASSVRDVIIKDDDLAAATHGRGFWILDNITPLRQVDPKITSADAFLFAPQAAIRVRWSMNTDTPLPPDTTVAENPPDGAAIDYYLGSSVTGPVTLEIKDSSLGPVRKYSSADKPDSVDTMLPIPTYWVRPAQTLSAAPGMHRFLWDMHYPRLAGVESEYPISAVPHNTAPQPTSPWVLPGQYTVILTVNGKSYYQPLSVKMDPRVKTSEADLARQFSLSYQIYNQLLTLAPVVEQAGEMRKQLKQIRAKLSEGTLAAAVDQTDQKLQALLGGGGGRRPGPANEAPTLGGMRTRYLALFNIFQEADVAPSTQASAGVTELQQQMPPLLARWQDFTSHDLPSLNAQLKRSNLPEVKVEAGTQAVKARASSQDKDEE
jgi:photosystem II stability/assembly factor-like uncharacterized protein